MLYKSINYESRFRRVCTKLYSYEIDVCLTHLYIHLVKENLSLAFWALIITYESYKIIWFDTAPVLKMATQRVVSSMCYIFFYNFCNRANIDAATPDENFHFKPYCYQYFQVKTDLTTTWHQASRNKIEPRTSVRILMTNIAGTVFRIFHIILFYSLKYLPIQFKTNLFHSILIHSRNWNSHITFDILLPLSILPSIHLNMIAYAIYCILSTYFKIRYILFSSSSI